MRKSAFHRQPGIATFMFAVLVALTALPQHAAAQTRPSLGGIQDSIDQHDQDVQDRLDALIPVPKGIFFFQNLATTNLPSPTCVTAAQADPGMVMMGSITRVDLPAGGPGTFLSLSTRATPTSPFFNIAAQTASNVLVREKNIFFTGVTLRFCNGNTGGITATTGTIRVEATAVQFPIQ